MKIESIDRFTLEVLSNDLKEIDEVLKALSDNISSASIIAAMKITDKKRGMYDSTHNIPFYNYESPSIIRMRLYNVWRVFNSLILYIAGSEPSYDDKIKSIYQFQKYIEWCIELLNAFLEFEDYLFQYVELLRWNNHPTDDIRLGVLKSYHTFTDLYYLYTKVFADANKVSYNIPEFLNRYLLSAFNTFENFSKDEEITKELNSIE